jgi:hypothetical protein
MKGRFTAASSEAGGAAAAKLPADVLRSIVAYSHPRDVAKMHLVCAGWEKGLQQADIYATVRIKLTRLAHQIIMPCWEIHPETH